MSRKKLALIISLIVSVAAIAGGIVYAQEASRPDDKAVMALLDAEAEASQDQDRQFSVFLDGGTYLGVSTEDISKENMARYSMRDVRGVGVTEVLKDSPAEKAGLRKDDVIVRFDGESVTSVRKLARLVSESAPDQTVHLTFSRGGAEQEVSVTLSKQELGGLLRAKIGDDVWQGLNKNFPYKIERGDLGDFGDNSFFFAFGNRRIGIGTQTLTKQLADYFGVKDGGVLITSVSENSPAAKAGLKAGDVITAIDGEKVTSPGDLTRALNKKETGDVSLTVIRDKTPRTVTLTPEKIEHPNIFRTGTLGTKRIVTPSIQIPDVNITIPRIVVPSIDVTVPARSKTRSVII
ncbi:MAG TPA: PDZ domain-containing protein [Pyrinomonadaceae bacterium]|nr:PDZ domain-containing protein [Pyrinomonadaceae bacterium]